jgi:hypothetical protein
VRVALPDSALFVAAGDVEMPSDLSTIGQTPEAVEQSAVEAAQAVKPLAAAPLTVEGAHVEPLPAPDQLLPEPAPPVVGVPGPITRSAKESPMFRDSFALVRDMAEQPLPDIASPVPQLPGSLPDPSRPLTSPTAGSSATAQTAPANRFGAAARRPGANLPQTPATTNGPSHPTVAPAPGPGRSPDQVRNSLSGFQAGTGRADRHETPPTTDQGTQR